MKKIAVYFCGHYRNLNETWGNYEKIFKRSDKFTIDFYFLLWTNKDVNDLSLITKEDILKICPYAKKVEFIDPNYEIPHIVSNFEPRLLNQLHCLNKCFEIIPNSYDMYIRLRTDLYFFDTDFMDEVVDMESDLILPDKVWYIEKNYPFFGLFNDFFWIANYQTSQYIANTYYFLSEIVDKSICLEKLLSIRLNNAPFKIKVSHFKCLFNLDRRTKGVEPWLTETIELTQKRKLLEKS